MRWVRPASETSVATENAVGRKRKQSHEAEACRVRLRCRSYMRESAHVCGESAGRIDWVPELMGELCRSASATVTTGGLARLRATTEAGRDQAKVDRAALGEQRHCHAHRWHRRTTKVGAHSRAGGSGHRNAKACLERAHD